MTDELFLSPDELHHLTGYQQAKRQSRQLKSWGIPHFHRPDGSLVVLRRDLTASDAPRGKAAPNLQGPGFREAG